MGIRQRNEFDGVGVSRKDLNLTKYDEKYILPTDGAFGGQTNNAFEAPGGTQSPIQTPAPDPDERNFVFGRDSGADRDARASVFGNRESNVQNNGYMQPAQGNYGNQSYAQNQPYAAPQPQYAQQPTYMQSAQPAPQQPYPVQSAPTQGMRYTAERPMVFVLRDDADMYVYEYSDRLEFYRRTDSGMVLCATKSKVRRF